MRPTFETASFFPRAAWEAWRQRQRPGGRAHSALKLAAAIAMLRERRETLTILKARCREHRSSQNQRNLDAGGDRVSLHKPKRLPSTPSSMQTHLTLCNPLHAKLAEQWAVNQDHLFNWTYSFPLCKKKSHSSWALLIFLSIHFKHLSSFKYLLLTKEFGQCNPSTLLKPCFESY